MINLHRAYVSCRTDDSSVRALTLAAEMWMGVKGKGRSQGQGSGRIAPKSPSLLSKDGAFDPNSFTL